MYRRAKNLLTTLQIFDRQKTIFFGISLRRTSGCNNVTYRILSVLTLTTNSFLSMVDGGVTWSAQENEENVARK